MAEPIVALQKAVARKSIVPSSAAGLHTIGAGNILRRDDVVLNNLALSDEREYQKMLDTSVAISSAWEQRVSGLLEHGSEVVAGPSDSPAANRNKDFAIRFLKGIPQWPTLQREMLMAMPYGWRPIGLEWEPTLQFEGRTHLGVTRAEAQWPWDYEFTVDRHLVQKAQGGVRDPIVFDSPSDRFAWVICTSGSTKTPYGISILRRLWMLYFLVKNFERMSSQAMQRSLGILKVAWTGGSSIDGSGSDQAEVETAITNMLEKLTANNVLLETADYSLEMVKSGEFSDSYRQLMDYFNTELRIGVAGQNLTSQVKGGSLAAAQVHQDMLGSLWKADGRQLAGWVNDQLLAHALELNFGVQPPEDLPKWRSLIFAKPDTEGLKIVLEHGGKVDGRRLAESYNVPLVAEKDEDVILEKMAPLSPFFGMPGEGDESQAAARLAAAPTGEEAAFVAADAALTEAFDAVLSKAGPSASDHYSGWAEQLLARNDPKD